MPRVCENRLDERPAAQTDDRLGSARDPQRFRVIMPGLVPRPALMSQLSSNRSERTGVIRAMQAADTTRFAE